MLSQRRRQSPNIKQHTVSATTSLHYIKYSISFHHKATSIDIYPLKTPSLKYSNSAFNVGSDSSKITTHVEKNTRFILNIVVYQISFDYCTNILYIADVERCVQIQVTSTLTMLTSKIKLYNFIHFNSSWSVKDNFNIHSTHNICIYKPSCRPSCRSK